MVTRCPREFRRRRLYALTDVDQSTREREADTRRSGSVLASAIPFGLQRQRCARRLGTTSGGLQCDSERGPGGGGFGRGEAGRGGRRRDSDQLERGEEGRLVRA